jgi:hypothetical protein
VHVGEWGSEGVHREGGVPSVFRSCGADCDPGDYIYEYQGDGCSDENACYGDGRDMCVEWDSLAVTHCPNRPHAMALCAGREASVALSSGEATNLAPHTLGPFVLDSKPPDHLDR